MNNGTRGSASDSFLSLNAILSAAQLRAAGRGRRLSVERAREGGKRRSGCRAPGLVAHFVAKAAQFVAVRRLALGAAARGLAPYAAEQAREVGCAIGRARGRGNVGKNSGSTLTLTLTEEGVTLNDDGATMLAEKVSPTQRRMDGNSPFFGGISRKRAARQQRCNRKCTTNG